jgi:hypothetical protein
MILSVRVSFDSGHWHHDMTSDPGTEPRVKDGSDVSLGWDNTGTHAYTEFF